MPPVKSRVPLAEQEQDSRTHSLVSVQKAHFEGADTISSPSFKLKQNSLAELGFSHKETAWLQSKIHLLGSRIRSWESKHTSTEEAGDGSQYLVIPEHHHLLSEILDQFADEARKKLGGRVDLLVGLLRLDWNFSHRGYRREIAFLNEKSPLVALEERVFFSNSPTINTHWFDSLEEAQDSYVAERFEHLLSPLR